MSTGTTFAFYLQEGWTLRRVVTAMVQEWLPPFRAEPVLKAARWVVQSVMESDGKAETTLWEPGISTSEYESRLDQTVRSWVIRATAGRGKGNILARLTISPEQPELLQLIAPETTFPETLFDPSKVDEYLSARGADAEGGLFAALLAENGFKRAN